MLRLKVPVYYLAHFTELRAAIVESSRNSPHRSNLDPTALPLPYSPVSPGAGNLVPMVHWAVESRPGGQGLIEDVKVGTCGGCTAREVTKADHGKGSVVSSTCT